MAITFKFGVVALFLIHSIYATALNLETKNHEEELAELRSLVEKLKPETFILEDYFLENWLRLRDFDWRISENITSILSEDWSDMRKIFPYTTDMLDKFGRPVLFLNASQWDFASYLAEGDAAYNRLSRYTLMYTEEMLAKIRKLRATGETVTKWVMVGNIGGFSPLKLACMKCLQFQRYISDISVKYNIHSFEKGVFVNVPYLFRMVYFFLSSETRSCFELYGQDRSQWETQILTLIDGNQLPAGLLEELSIKDNLDGLLQWNKEL